MQIASRNDRLRILVVDDYQDNAESLAMVLRLHGYEAATAQNGLEALKTADMLSPHVVLCDLSMPGMSGYEVARRLRRSLGETLLLIAISANDFLETHRSCLASGFDHHFLKPANPVALLRILREFSGRVLSAQHALPCRV